MSVKEKGTLKQLFGDGWDEQRFEGAHISSLTTDKA